MPDGAREEGRNRFRHNLGGLLLGKILVDVLVPEDLRGQDLQKHKGISLNGQSFTYEDTYENVLVRVYGSLVGVAGGEVIIITWPKRACGEAQRVAD